MSPACAADRLANSQSGWPGQLRATLGPIDIMIFNNRWITKYSLMLAASTILGACEPEDTEFDAETGTPLAPVHDEASTHELAGEINAAAQLEPHSLQCYKVLNLSTGAVTSTSCFTRADYHVWTQDHVHGYWLLVDSRSVDMQVGQTFEYHPTTPVGPRVTVTAHSNSIHVQGFTAGSPASSGLIYRLEWKKNGSFRCIYPYNSKAHNWTCWSSDGFEYWAETSSVGGVTGSRFRHVETGECLRTASNGLMTHGSCSNATVFVLRPDGNGVELRIPSPSGDRCVYGDLDNGERVRHTTCSSSTSTYSYKLNVP